jgi:hypothetical protein
MKSSFVSVLMAGFLATVVVSECPNACSAHGKCGAYDMCSCYRNWMSNDCSERICQFGLAHVDTPKGDLDSSSGKLSNADTIVVPNNAMYPFGTTEQYPFVGDIDGMELTNTAHEYRECSNKGMCDRGTGTCACFEGYEGSACQRASCPVTNGAMCSGHGTCHTIEEIAHMDHHNIYELWDSSSTMGCVCDSGYGGSDCADRMCPTGTDPLYFDSGSTMRYSNWTYQFVTTNVATPTIMGNYSIIFFDAHGEDWHTDPIDWDASCATVVWALEHLPNSVVPLGSVRCYKHDVVGAEETAAVDNDWTIPVGSTSLLTATTIHSKYTIAFPGNPGKLKQMEITNMLDGKRPTLFSSETATSTLKWHIYPNGFYGEDVDMVPDLCEGVLVSLGASGLASYLLSSSITVQEAKALKRCLGGSNNPADMDNVEVYDWDYGDYFNPHLIKLVDQTQYSSTQIGNAVDINHDPMLGTVPTSTLCNPVDMTKNMMHEINTELYGTGHATSGNPGLCADINPAGFFTVLFYQPADADLAPSHLINSENSWRLMMSPKSGTYSATTEFAVYTTTGYLQLVNPYSAVFTTAETFTVDQKRNAAYTNVLHVTNTSGMAQFTHADPAGDWHGWMDCETQQNADGTYLNGNLACLNKNDYVMFIAYNGTNAHYPNMYQIDRLNRAEKNFANDYTDFDIDAVDVLAKQIVNDNKIRTTITLDKSTNTNMHYHGEGPNAGDRFANNIITDTSARVYKFYPPAHTASYAYAGVCSHRGVCNHDNGMCECFGGYTNQNCDTINALAL